MKRNIVHSVLIVISAICAFASPYSVDRIPNVHLADQTKYVSNPDGIVSPEAVAAVDSTLNRLRRETTAEAVAVVVSDIDGEDIDLFANELFNSWGLGKSDNNNGLLILVAVDRRKAVIRTGTGIEGLLPDGYCGRILRKKMFPAFARGDYDGGLIAAVNEVAARLGDETAAAEIRSEMDDADDASSSVSPLKVYLGCSAALALILAVIVIIKVASLRKKPPYDKYTAFENWKAPLLIFSFAGLGIPLIVTIPLLLMMKHWRNSPRLCPNCHHRMQKIDEVHDNDYLTPAQDCEERIGSVDYDVWHCPSCGETDIFPFVNKSMPLVECSNCHARTAKLTADRIETQPTQNREGVGIKEFTCLNCGHKTYRPYKLAKLAPVVILPAGGSGRGGGFGGGSIGGGFGGGFTGGGGASGGW